MKNYLIIVMLLIVVPNTIAQQTTHTITIQPSQLNSVKKSPGPYYSLDSPRMARFNGTGGPFYYRSVMIFDVSQVVESKNVTINQVKLRYTTSVNNSNFKFYVTNIDALPYDNYGYIINEELWDVIVDTDTLEVDIPYKSFTSSGFATYISAGIKDQISNNISHSKLNLGFFSKSETNVDAGTSISAYLEITYTFDTYYDLTVRNDFSGQDGGLVGVGINGSTVQRNSPFTFTTENNTLLNLEAYDSQVNGSYTWVFNDTEASNNSSEWRKQIGFAPFIEIGSSQSLSYITYNDDGAKISNIQRRLHNVSRIDQTEMGNTSAGVVATAVQGNGATITTPATKIVNGTTLQFAGWSDGVITNPRTITPTDHTTLTTLYKGPHISSINSAYSNSGQRKIVQSPNGWQHMVYESMGHVWYEVRWS